MENTELLPLGTEQGHEETEYSSFDLCLGESFVSPLVEQHRQWLKSIRHETPSPKIPFKVAVYIRFFNQTKYGDEEYLERNKEVFRATLAQYTRSNARFLCLWGAASLLGRRKADTRARVG